MDAYFSCVDVVGVDFVGVGVGAYSHDAVFALEVDVDVFREDGGEEGWNSDTKIDIHSISDLLCCSFCDF